MEDPKLHYRHIMSFLLQKRQKCVSNVQKMCPVYAKDAVSIWMYQKMVWKFFKKWLTYSTNTWFSFQPDNSKRRRMLRFFLLFRSVWRSIVNHLTRILKHLRGIFFEPRSLAGGKVTMALMLTLLRWITWSFIIQQPRRFPPAFLFHDFSTLNNRLHQRKKKQLSNRDNRSHSISISLCLVGISMAIWSLESLR